MYIHSEMLQQSTACSLGLRLAKAQCMTCVIYIVRQL
jgi:hypothetical protein